MGLMPRHGGIGLKRGARGAWLALAALIGVAVPELAAQQVAAPPARTMEAAFADLEEASGLRAGGSFPFDYQNLVFFRGPDAPAELVTAVSVHAGRVRGVFEGGWKYRLEMRTEIFRGGELVAADTSRVQHTLNMLIPPDVSDGFPLQTRLLVPPGEYEFHIVVRDRNWEGDRGTNDVSGTVVIPAFEPDRPFVSSIAVAADSFGTWSPTPGVELKLNAARIVKTDARPFVYFEVYGLTPGGRYRGEVRLVSTWVSRGKGEEFRGVYRPFQMQYRGTAPTTEDRPVHAVFRLDMRNTEPGPYEVQVRVTDLTTGMHSETRRTQIKVRDPDNRGPVVPIAEVSPGAEGG